MKRLGANIERLEQGCQSAHSRYGVGENQRALSGVVQEQGIEEEILQKSNKKELARH